MITEGEMKYRKALGEVLRQSRTDRNLTQSEVGDYIGLSKDYISYYESGKRKPSEETIEQLAEIYKLTVKGIKTFAQDKVKQEFKWSVNDFLDLKFTEDMVFLILINSTTQTQKNIRLSDTQVSEIYEFLK